MRGVTQPLAAIPQVRALSSEPSTLSPEPAQPASASAGLNVPQVLPRSTLELKVRHFSRCYFYPYTAPATRTLSGSQSAKVAPKRVLSAQTRFGAPKTPKNVVHVCQSAACVILERKELQRRHLSVLERLDPSEHQKTSYLYAKVRKWIFVTLFSFFQK